MNVFSGLLIIILIILLIQSYVKNHNILKKMNNLLNTRDTALDISNRVVNTDPTVDLYQYILESCLQLIPKAKFGSILMFNSENLLIAKASVGFNRDEISKFKLKLEESFIYIATSGNIEKTEIINRLEDIVLEKNIVKSGDKGFALRSEISSPLIINNKLVGLLCIDGDEHDIFTEHDVYIMDYISKQISNVINNQRLYNEIFYLSRYDNLTNFLNRNSFEDEANKLLANKLESPKHMHFVLFDLDDLKEANDTFGHHYGDQILRSFSEIVREYLNEGDICGRYGGDEFVAIFNRDIDILFTQIEEMKRSINSNIGLDKSNYTPSFSYGVASFNEGNHSLIELYKLADMRMYNSKKKEKNVCNTFFPHEFFTSI